MQSTPTAPRAISFAIVKNRTRFFGLSLDECIQVFFGGNAMIAMLVLTLITIFLFREGAAFFGENRQNLKIYRTAGLEYVDYIRQVDTDHAALGRFLSSVRVSALDTLRKEKNLSLAEANKQLAPFDDFAGKFSDSGDAIRGLVSDYGEMASAIKTKAQVNQDKTVERAQLVESGKVDEAKRVELQDIDFEKELAPLRAALPAYREASQTQTRDITTLLQAKPKLASAALDGRLNRFEELAKEYLAGLPAVAESLEKWDYKRPISFIAPYASFLFGRDWQTASFWQDWYGVVPLFVGSLMVSLIALAIAVPLGVGAAIYINQIASRTEQRVIKPMIEFISAIPSVVLGFFGIAVLGQLLRAISQVSWLSWVPGFPMAERLNALTAGCLLALIAVPTIFTLAEDAINNVPRSFREASFALGANRLQTIVRITVPAALSGIISAVLLGFGRVIGETMVVLLCAGNRIAIPDFTAGLGVISQPVHTMTGIIAQEMGEVVRNSIHYRALFVVGIVLFFLSLAINYVAQKIVGRYRLAIG